MKMEIANRLYERRKACGLSQEQVATLLGVSRQAVSKWECADSSPDTDNLIALSRLYGVSMDDLLFSDVPMEEASEQKVPKQEAPVQDEEVTARETDEPAFKNEEQTSEPPVEDESPEEPANKRDDAPKDYVNISLENGIHVRDSKKGDEVHVGWDGIHVDTADDEHVHIDLTGIMDVLSTIIKNRKPSEQGGHANFTSVEDVAESILEARKQNSQRNQQ